MYTSMKYSTTEKLVFVLVIVIALVHHQDLLHLLSREHLPVFHQLLTDNIIALYYIVDSKDQL